MKNPDKDIAHTNTSFHLTLIDREQLQFICEAYGQKNRSSVIRRLIQDAYSIIKYRPDQTKVEEK